VGRQTTATDSHSQTCLQTFFLSPYLWWENNRTTPACWKTYWNCISFALGGLLFFVCVSNFVLLSVSPLKRQLQNNIWDTISRIGGWGTNTKEKNKTEISLHLNLEVFIFYFLFFLFYFIYFFFHLLIFLFLFLSLLFLFFIFNPLSVALMSFQLTVD
jgi:hypothetical protein